MQSVFNAEEEHDISKYCVTLQAVLTSSWLAQCTQQRHSQLEPAPQHNSRAPSVWEWPVWGDVIMMYDDVIK